MKQLNFSKVLVLLLAAIATSFIAGCSGSEGTGPDNNNGDFDALVGDWRVTQFAYIAVSDPNLTFDLLASQGITVSMTIRSDGSYTTTTTVGGQTQTSSGQFVNTNGNFSDGDPNTTMTITSNQIIWSIANESWDFGNGFEPATLEVIYTRQ